MYDKFAPIFINGNKQKVYIGNKPIKIRHGLLESRDSSILTINCTENFNTLNIFNQVGKTIESVKILNEYNININDHLSLPDIEVDSDGNSNTTWNLPNGYYRVLIKGEFSVINSTCKFININLHEKLTIGYKMFYNCTFMNIKSENEIIIPDSMINTESMFENSNISLSSKINLSVIKNCRCMYKDCDQLKSIGQDYIDVFNNENELAPNLIKYDECFFGCINISCENNNITAEKPNLIKWEHIPYSWGGDQYNKEYNYFEANPNSINGMVLMLYQAKDEKGNVESLYETNWGDGTINTETTHAYQVEGFYNIKTKLQPGTRNIAIIPSEENTENVTNTTNIYNGKTKNLITKIFSIRENLTDMSYMFYKCEILTSVRCENINVSNVKTMQYLFADCSSLSSLDLSCWDVSKVTDMTAMFRGCKSLSSINLNNWNTSSLLTTVGMFGECKSLTSLDFLSNFNVDNVKNMAAMFNKSGILNVDGISNFNTSKVSDMGSLFSECENLSSIEGIKNWNVSNLIDIAYMFYKCLLLNEIDLSLWSTKEITQFEKIFSSCGASTIKAPNLNISKCSNFSEVFKDCTNLSVLDISNWNMNSATNVSYMFENCNKLINYSINIIFSDGKEIIFNNFISNSSINYLYISGVPTKEKLQSLINNLTDLTLNNNGILDITKLDKNLILNLLSDGDLEAEANAKGWEIKQTY